MTEPYFEIHERQEGGGVRLQLMGELDMASEPYLRNRLRQLRAEKRFVRLDLSSLEFMDASGIRLLISAFDQADRDRWEFEVDPDLSPHVDRLFKVASLEGVSVGQRRG